MKKLITMIQCKIFSQKEAELIASVNRQEDDASEAIDAIANGAQLAVRHVGVERDLDSVIFLASSILLKKKSFKGS